MAARDTEIIFVVEQDADGGYVAASPTHHIFTEGGDLDELRRMVRDAVACAFEGAEKPKLIRLHFVHDEVIAA